MDVETYIKGLHPLEIKLLRKYKSGDKITSSGLISELSYNPGQCNQAFSWLSAKELIEEIERVKRVEYELTGLGREYREKGTPEERIYQLIHKEGTLCLPEMADKLSLEKRDVGSAFGSLSKEGLLSLNADKQVMIKDESRTEKLESLRQLLDLFCGGAEGSAEQAAISETELSPEQAELASSLSRKRGTGRGLFRVTEKEEVTYGVTTEGEKLRRLLIDRKISGEEIGVITPEVIKSGEWREKGFRGYNLNIPPLRVLLGRKNPYVEFLERSRLFHLTDYIRFLPVC